MLASGLWEKLLCWMLKASFRSAIYNSSFLATFVPVFGLSLGVYVIACPDVVQKCLERERGVLAPFLVRMMLLGICFRVYLLCFWFCVLVFCWFSFLFLQSLSSFTNVSTCLFVQELCSPSKLRLATALLSLKQSN